MALTTTCVRRRPSILFTMKEINYIHPADEVPCKVFFFFYLHLMRLTFKRAR